MLEIRQNIIHLISVGRTITGLLAANFNFVFVRNVIKVSSFQSGSKGPFNLIISRVAGKQTYVSPAIKLAGRRKGRNVGLMKMLSKRC
jgi:hypothetical protein